MSKMSEIAMELDDQAVELGFESYEEAIAKGYDVCYGEEGVYLYEKKPEDEQLKAHKAWLKEKESVLADLEELRNGFVEGGYQDEINALNRAIEFVKKGEM